MSTIEEIRKTFEEKFGGKPQLVRSPGRINLIGEHTDYNNGYVLPGAIDKHIYFAVQSNKDRVCRFIANDLGERAEVDLRNIIPEERLWVNYLAGILHQFQKDETSVGGVDCVFGGDLPIGSGMSSSAALECGFAYSLNQLFGLGYSRINLAQLAQQSSHQFVGIQCGIMDQFASLMGKRNHFLLLDCQSLDHEYYPSEMEGYQVVLLNSKVDHELASSAYTRRVEECREGVALLNRHYSSLGSLREVKPAMLEKHREELGDLLWRRCSYVVEENLRVTKVCSLLKQGKWPEIGVLMFQTHKGLRDKYEVSCREIDFLVDFAHDDKGVIGARVMGGGFGGCTINLVQEEKAQSFAEQALKAYKTTFAQEGEAYLVNVGMGASVVEF